MSTHTPKVRPHLHTSWSLRRDLREYVTADGDEIAVFIDGRTFWVSRATARLLAKRINQCLDATVKR